VSSARRAIFASHLGSSAGSSAMQPRVEHGSGEELHLPADDNCAPRPYAAAMAETAAPMSDGERDVSAARWLRRLGLATVAVVVALSFGEHPAPGLTRAGLVVTLALIALVAAVLRARGRRGAVLAPVAIIAASAALVWTQHAGAGVAGMFVAVAFAAMRLPLRGSLAILALALVAWAVAAAHAQRSLGAAVGAELGIVAFYAIAAFARSTREAHEQTARLLAELQATRQAREEAAALRERSRIAREMHDVLAHSLSGLMLQLEGARMLAAMPSSNGRLPAALDRAHHLARAGMQEARRAVDALRDEDPPGADGLARLAADFSRDSNIEAKLEVHGTPRRLDSETSLTLFRVAQEALTNARKHARPERVLLRLDYEPAATRLVVEDHRGPGSAPLQPALGAGATGMSGAGAGYGLTGMRERAELLGGWLEAAPTGDGFRVELWVPA
jgi:signal transduction histidine kinase